MADASDPGGHLVGAAASAVTGGAASSAAGVCVGGCHVPASGAGDVAPESTPDGLPLVAADGAPPLALVLSVLGAGIGELGQSFEFVGAEPEQLAMSVKTGRKALRETR